MEVRLSMVPLQLASEVSEIELVECLLYEVGETIDPEVPFGCRCPLIIKCACTILLSSDIRCI
jgi:hypothetical protein